jgi:rod shape determining protein RodA
MMFDRRLVQHFDWGLMILTILLGCAGLMTLRSAVTAGVRDPQKILYVKQCIWFGAGVTVMIISFVTDYKNLKRWAYPFYGFCVVLLICVLVFGKYAGGSKRWLVLGPASLQPSELIKIAVVIVLARYYSDIATSEGLTFRELVKPFVLLLIPFVMIVKQPDLGTAMTMFLIAASVTLFVKIRWRTFFALVIPALFLTIPAWFFALKEYQRQRILTFLDPDRDPLGAGYHIIQSKIAIGSGMMYGKGWMRGSQNALSFLPEHHTDFIFSVLAEEWGFVGSAILILLFLTLIIWGLNIAYGCRDPFGTILCVGVTAIIFWQSFINIGMVMGLMPVVGVPLPFVSYGGSSVMAMMCCIGILMNVSMRRFMFE